MGKAFDAIADCATVIDATQTWQVVYGAGNFDKDVYELTAVSRGPIPRLPEGVFGDISDSVTLDVNPEDDSHTTVHVVKYIGGLAGMQFFANMLADELNHGAEGDIDMISGFVSRNPFWMLG